MDDAVYDGVPVYPHFEDTFHAPDAFHDRPIPLVDGSWYWVGWDCGQTLNPALVVDQVTPRTRQVQSLMEVISYGGESMAEFAPRAYNEIEKVYPGLTKNRNLKHTCDPAARQRSGTNRVTAIQEAMKHGFRLHPSPTNAWIPRHSAVANLLQRRLEQGKPGYVLCAHHCPTLRAGFRGAYKFRVSSSGDPSGPGVVQLEPLKDSYSHVQDAKQYAAMDIETFLSRLDGRGESSNALQRRRR
jgi:hypothetical protein